MFDYFGIIDLVSVVASVATFAALLAQLIAIVRQQRQQNVQQRKINNLEEEATSARRQHTFTEFFVTTLRGATERERLTMLRAEASAGRFSLLGTVLMVLSVLAPLISWAVYASLEPLTLTSIAYLKQLRTDTGYIPGGDAISIGRDWHILLAGLSLGFLFVAAARGILRQEAQQRTNFLALARRVAYYENLAWAIQVYDRLQEETGAVRHASEAILRELIKPPVEVPATKPSAEEGPLLQSEQIDAVVSLLRGEGAVKAKT